MSDEENLYFMWWVMFRHGKGFRRASLIYYGEIGREIKREYVYLIGCSFGCLCVFVGHCGTEHVPVLLTFL